MIIEEELFNTFFNYFPVFSVQNSNSIRVSLTTHHKFHSTKIGEL